MKWVKADLGDGVELEYVKSINAYIKGKAPPDVKHGPIVISQVEAIPKCGVVGCHFKEHVPTTDLDWQMQLGCATVLLSQMTPHALEVKMRAHNRSSPESYSAMVKTIQYLAKVLGAEMPEDEPERKAKAEARAKKRAKRAAEATSAEAQDGG